MKLEVLENAARKCGALVIRLRKQGVTATDKDDVQGSHFATEADIGSQELGIKIIHKSFPEEIIIAEEQEHEGSVPPDCTVFDPVDGTTVFYNGGDHWGVTLGTLREGKPVMGVIYLPDLDIMITCERGKGVFINGEQVAKFEWKRPLDKILLTTDIGSWIPIDVIQSLTREGFPILSFISAVRGGLSIIRQEAGAYLNMNAAKIWDIAAIALMVEELGGVVTDPWGKPPVWDRINMDWVMAVNQEVADAVLKHTKIWAGRG